jgi:hypothetical protein
MVERDPSQMSLPDLIAALLLNGGVSHSARATAILAELRRRTGQDLGADPKAWWDWFLPTRSLDEVALQYAETRRRIREIERRALGNQGR